MRFRIAFILLCCLVCSGSLVSFARTSKSAVRTVDPSYGPALAAANRFLHAWQTQDHETGLMMLTDAARQRVSPERLQVFFSPGPEAAFEIQHGKQINGGEYVFPVVLFGVSNVASRPRVCSIVITRAGKDEWVVQKLP
jgi:hypothetical protein